MRYLLQAALVLGIAIQGLGQTQNFYDVTAGDGYGYRFWNGSDNYKMAMGNTSEYHYGPVQSYSIKMHMNDASNRGWTWGINGQVPKAALSTGGVFPNSSEIDFKRSGCLCWRRIWN